MADDFSFNVHPFRFPSASGLTPHLKLKGLPPPRSGRDRLRAGGESQAHSSFGGKSGDSRVWLTPRTSTAVHAQGKGTGYNSGSMTDRSTRPVNNGPPIPTTRELGRKRHIRSQAIQGMTWRFLRQGAPQEEEDRSMISRGGTGGGLRRGGDVELPEYNPKVKGMDPLAGLDGGFFGTAKHEKAFETLIQGTGGTGDLQEEYAKFESAVRKRVEAVAQEEQAKGEGYKTIGREAKEVFNNLPRDEDEEEEEDGSRTSGGSSDEEQEAYRPTPGGVRGTGRRGQMSSTGRRGLAEPVPTSDPKPLTPPLAVRESLILFDDVAPPAAPPMAGPPSGVTRLDLTNALAEDEYVDDDLRSRQEQSPSARRRGGLHLHSKGHEEEDMEEEEDEEDEEEEDDDGLNNPHTAPCIIWHTPVRVKIAANLPQELRDELESDSAFVRDERVVPDIWDQKFLPVSRRSVAAPIPPTTPRYRASKYGAWYMPVNGWGTSRQEKLNKGGAGGDDVAGMMDKMEKEIVKLCSSRMFYQYIKSEKLRVPHYLRKMESGAAGGE